MNDSQARMPGPDDTAAFQRFYAGRYDEYARSRSVLYRIFVSWWRDKA